MLKWIDEQTYKLVLSAKYAHLHSVFSIQLLENYCHHHDNAELMMMSDLENLQNEWNMKKVRNKWWIKNTIHYLIKWADWSSEYNFYESASHLINASKTVADSEHRLKCKQKKISKTTNIDEASNFEDVTAFHKQMLIWDHVISFIL